LGHFKNLYDDDDDDDDDERERDRNTDRCKPATLIDSISIVVVTDIFF